MLVPLKIPPGVARGATPNDTPGRWYETNLIRWRQGVMEPIGGWVKESATGLPLANRIRRIHRWRNNANTLRTMVLTDTEIRNYTSSGGYVNITPSDFVDLATGITLPVGYGVGPYGAEAYGTARSTGSETISVSIPAWSFANWGEDVVLCANSDGRILYYDDTAPTTAVVPIGVSAVSTISRTSNVVTVVTATAHNLDTGDLAQIAGVTDSTYDTAAASVTVSDSTTFTYANTGTDGSSSGGTVRKNEVPINNEFVFVTPERHIVVLGPEGLPRRVQWCSREAIYDWDNASTTNTAGFIDLETRTSLITAMNVRNGTLIFSGSEVFIMRYVGQPFVYGFDNLEETRLVGPRTLAHDSGVCYWWSKDGFFASDGSQVRPIPCDIWNWITECMCPTNSPSLAFASDHGDLPEIWFFFPSRGSTVCDNYVVYNWLEGWWTMGTLTRAAMVSALGNQKPLMADTSGNIYEHETGWQGGAGSSRDGLIYAETSVLNIPPSGERNAIIKQGMFACPNGTATIQATFYTKQTPQGSERTFGPYSVRDDGYIDLRVQGRDVRIRIDSLGDADWSLGEIRLDVAAGAKR